MGDPEQRVPHHDAPGGAEARAGTSPSAEPSGAVFLSYASQDAHAAQRICQGLRAAGIEVWFDQSELRGGDAWDRQIRKQIHDCALFVPVISAHSDARHEGHFRREWRLAVERAGDMAEDVPFLLPVVIDSTPDATARVPDRFREVQWSRLPDGQATPAFVQRVLRLAAPEPSTTNRPATSPTSGAVLATRGPLPPSTRSRPILLASVAVVVLLVLAYLLVDKFWMSKHPVTSQPATSAQQATPTASPTPAAFNPPPHSIAVLPFVNMSADANQQYFSDGLTEELLNSLSRINELQVAARTSSFSFQGEHPDISTVAHKLNVGTVLEGSVRRSANTVRVTAQLINGVTGFHLWSETYDRDLGDVLKLQTEIANAVASALKVSLLGDVAAKVELGGTRNPAAFDAYLKGSQAYRIHHDAKELNTAIAAYTEAIQLDPTYALAYVGRSRAIDQLGSWWVSTMAEGRELYIKAQADARKAVALAPDLGEGHLVLANSLFEQLDFARASEEYERARALAPGSALVLQDYGLFAALMGHTEQGLSAARRAVRLDPLNRGTHLALVDALSSTGQQEQAISVTRDALVLDPT
jgi:TolB-like protein